MPTASMHADIYRLTRIALTLGRVERGVNHPDGKPETDTDHSVSLGWLACSLASTLYPQLDTGLIAQLAIVHDAVEAYAGDMYAVTATASERDLHKQREAEALRRIRGELPVLAWLPQMIAYFEEQECPEARFVWAIDKLMPKIVLRIEGSPTETLRAHGAGRTSVRAYNMREREQFETRIADFPEILKLLEELHQELALDDEEIALDGCN